MNTRKLLVLVLLFVCILLPACAAPATQVKPSDPPVAPPTVTSSPGETIFSSKIYQLHMTVNFKTADWHISDDFSDLVTVDRTGQDFGVGFNIVTDAKVADPISGAQVPFPADFAAWVKSNPNFKSDPPTDVTVAGFAGIQIDATPMVGKQTDFLYMSRTKWNLITKPEKWRFIMLDNVNGERLLILLISPADQFKDAFAQAQTILDSVVFSK